MGLTDVKGPIQTFRWAGVHWTAGELFGRLLWVAIAVAIALLAAAFFQRFDPARERLGVARKKAGQAAVALAPGTATAEPLAPVAVARPARLPSPLTQRSSLPLLAAVRAELLLARAGLRWWWYIVAGGLIVAGALAPLPIGLGILLPAAWIWPLPLWSAMGAREARHDTARLVFSTPHPLRRQLAAVWCAGVMLAALTGSGVAGRLLVQGQLATLFAWCVGALFIPTLALALGTWSGSSRLFEALYFLLWYIGPLSHLPALDFMGATDAAVRAHVALIYLVGTLALGVLAVAGRARQLRRAA
jgi:hypothetical protein